ncbi:carboxymuconolactone decarboxylase family protein [Aeromonas caviae]|uniref:carboxymuconolactone decarboxylase family protein n=1 Tax=Aeromonas caviae TaxID=648 RepID=UPI0038D09383
MSGSHTDRRERAFALLARLDPQAPTRVAASLDALSPELAELVLGFAFADVLARPGIDLCTREMLTVATLMGMGTAPGQLEFHIRAALNVGVSRETIIEILLQVAVYAGVPACMNGISAARSAFAAHDKGRGAGIKEETSP